MFAFFLFQLALTHRGYTATLTVNDFVTFTPIESTFTTTADTKNCPPGFVGIFSFNSILTNKKTSPILSNLILQVNTLTNGNLLLNADGGPGGVGAIYTLGFPLNPGESQGVLFEICLTNRNSFSFFVNVITVSEPILILREPDIDGFDRELFASNGFNTSEVFNIGNYRQANFRLAQRNDPNLTIDWDQFVNLVSSVTSTADSIHGIPLLIGKVDFTVALPEIKTFFMAVLAAETIFYRDVTIISSPAFHLSADPVERIFLELEGSTIELDPAGNSPLQFSSAGEKTLRLIVEFRSGFVGTNLFRVVVE